MKKIASFLSLLVFLSGCVRTNIVSFKNPSYSSLPIKSFTAVVNTSDLSLMHKIKHVMPIMHIIESVFENDSKDRNLSFQKTSELLAFSNKVSANSFLKKLKQKRIQAYLVISAEKNGEKNNSFYVPERIEGVKTTSTSSTRGYGSSSYNGNSNFYGGYSGTGSSTYNSNSSGTSVSKIIRSGGYSVVDLNGNYTLDLIDVRTKKKIWTATIEAKMSGNFASWDSIYEKIASEAIIKMEEDGIIPEIKWNENYNDNEVKNTNAKLPIKRNTTSNSNQEPACDKNSFIYIMFGSC